MKIALITDGIWPFRIGGMQRHSYYLLKYLARNKVSVDLYCPPVRESELRHIYSNEELAYIDVIPTQFPRYYFPGHYFLESYVYSKNIFKELVTKKNQYNLIYIQGLSGAYLMQHKEQLSLPIILNPHGLEMFQMTFSVRSKLEQVIFRRYITPQLKKADYVQSLGGKLTDILIQVGIPETKIFKCGIGIEASWCSTQSTTINLIKRFVFVGRNERRKGIEELNTVIKSLIDEEKKFEFHFIGDIPTDKQIVHKQCIYHGIKNDNDSITKLLDIADFLVVPSCAEGMPTVILEGMARRCAVIATDVGAVSEQVNNQNGIIVASGDVNHLKAALENALVMPVAELHKKKENSIDRIKAEFLWEKISGQMLFFFKSVLHQV